MDVHLFHFNNCQDLSLMEIGEQRCDPLYSFGPVTRNDYILHLVLSGQGRILYSANREENPDDLRDQRVIHAGECFLFAPKEKHMYIADETDPWHYIWVVFNGMHVPSYLRACGLTPHNPVLIPTGGEAGMEEIMQPLRQILHRSDASRAFLIGNLHLFFDQLMKHTPTERAFRSTEVKIANIYIEEATRYIAEQYATICSLDEIAEYCNITRSHLARLFKRSLRVTLQDYLINYRINKAKELLMNTNAPVYQIAEQVGYENVVNFNKIFKARCGVPPRIWRIQSKTRLGSSLTEKNE